MKNAKIKVLWSNYFKDLFTPEQIEWAKQGLFEEGIEESENEIDDYIYRENDYEFEDFRRYMDYLMKNKNQMLAKGSVGRWNGSYEGGKIINTFRELLDLFEDCDYIKFEDENGHLYVTGSHQDGSIYIEVKELTQKGEDYADRHEYDMSDRNLHEKLWNSSNYSRLFRYE